MSDGLYLGLDGGGTRTRCVAIDAGGTVMARAEGPSGLLPPNDPTAIVPGLAGLVEETLHQVGSGLPAAALVAGLAGAWREQPRREVEAAFSAAGLARKVRVATDLDVAFRAAFGMGAGIALISGTGSSAYGSDGAGRTLSAGGWGRVIGDEGSGWWIAVEGLRAAMKARDGRGTATPLREALAHAADLAHEELPAWTERASKREVAALAPIVLEHADDGDPVARAIREQAVESLVEHIGALANRLHLNPPVPVALIGGLVEPGGPLRPRLEQKLTAAGCAVKEGEVDAALGAALWARDGAED